MPILFAHILVRATAHSFALASGRVTHILYPLMSSTLPARLDSTQGIPLYLSPLHGTLTTTVLGLHTTSVHPPFHADVSVTHGTSRLVHDQLDRAEHLGKDVTLAFLFFRLAFPTPATSRDSKSPRSVGGKPRWTRCGFVPSTAQCSRRCSLTISAWPHEHEGSVVLPVALQAVTVLHIDKSTIFCRPL